MEDIASDVSHGVNKLMDLHEYYPVVRGYADKTGDANLWNLANDLFSLDIDAKIVGGALRDSLLGPVILGVILVIVGLVLQRVKGAR